MPQQRPSTSPMHRLSATPDGSRRSSNLHVSFAHMVIVRHHYKIVLTIHDCDEDGCPSTDSTLDQTETSESSLRQALDIVTAYDAFTGRLPSMCPRTLAPKIPILHIPRTRLQLRSSADPQQPKRSRTPSMSLPSISLTLDFDFAARQIPSSLNAVELLHIPLHNADAATSNTILLDYHDHSCHVRAHHPPTQSIQQTHSCCRKRQAKREPDREPPASRYLDYAESTNKPTRGDSLFSTQPHRD